MARKVTVIVEPDSAHQKVVAYIMRKYGQVEVNRTIVGGYMSPVMLAITYEGGNHNDHLYKDMYCTVEPEKCGKTPQTGFKMYYNIDVLNGYYTNSLKSFKKHLSDLESDEDFEVHKF